MTDKQAKLCRSCAYWYPERMATSHMGECRRYPPMVDGWPISKGEDWCGERQAKQSAPAVMTSAHE